MGEGRACCFLEEVTGNQRNKEYRAKEIFEILERPPQTY
jgi:hypothetical protein